MPFFYDKDNNEYKAEFLSEGGQGAVYRTEDKTLAIKVSNKEGEVYKEYVKKLNAVLSVFAEDSVHIAFPIIALKDECGYVMEFLDGATDMGKLLIPAGKMGEVLNKYNSTGGLKRRLLLLYDLAKTLHGLHKFGYVYGDISDKNVFISAMTDVKELNESNTRVCLIDADNVTKFTECTSMIYTPGYGAPELVLRVRTNSIESDMYSFALLAYRLLNINDPFDGPDEGEEDSCGWDDDTVTGEVSKAETTAAERGEKSFIFDGENSVCASGIIPYSFGCTKKLIKLFRKAFSYGSRTLMSGRPSAFEWACALAEAVDSLVYCPKCHAHHYFRAMPCGSAFKGVIVHTDYLNYADGDYIISDSAETVLADNVTQIYDRKTQRTNLSPCRMFDLKLTEKEFEIENLSPDYEYRVFRKGELINGGFNVLTCEVWVSKKGGEEYFARLRFEVKE